MHVTLESNIVKQMLNIRRRTFFRAYCQRNMIKSVFITLLVHRLCYIKLNLFTRVSRLEYLINARIII